MTPAEYATEIVIPTVREFRDDPQSRRRAYMACMVTYHIGDYLVKAGVPKTRIPPAMRASGGGFDVVQAICNATKHSGHGHPHAVPFSPGDDYDRPPAVWDEAVFDVTIWDDAMGGREISVAGSGVDIYRSICATLAAFKINFPPHLDAVDLSEQA